MNISDRVRRLSPSLTLALVARTKELRAEGRRILSLGAGEPDFLTPSNVRRAAAEAMEAGHTRYTEVGGILPLRQAVAAQYLPYGLHYDPSQVVVTTGAKQALFNALMCLVDPGDEVLIPSPSWLSYPEMVKAAGGVPVHVPCREEANFRLEPGALTAALTERSKILMVNPVSNPTGSVHGPDDLHDIAAVCEEHGLAVISDEIYERLVYPPATCVPFASAHAAAAERTVTVSGVSKTYAMTGWRIGYASGPKDVIAAMTKLQGQSTSNATSVSQYAALEALTGDQSVVTDMLAEFQARRDRVVELLRAIPDVTVGTPEGAFYAFPRVDAYYGRRPGIDGSLALAEALLEEAGVVVVPGLPFGSDAHIRLSYACGLEDIEEAMGKLAEFLASL